MKIGDISNVEVRRGWIKFYDNDDGPDKVQERHYVILNCGDYETVVDMEGESECITGTLGRNGVWAYFAEKFIDDGRAYYYTVVDYGIY